MAWRARGSRHRTPCVGESEARRGEARRGATRFFLRSVRCWLLFFLREETVHTRRAEQKKMWERDRPHLLGTATEERAREDDRYATTAATTCTMPTDPPMATCIRRQPPRVTVKHVVHLLQSFAADGLSITLKNVTAP